MFQIEVTQLLDWATCVIINSNAIYADVKNYNNYFVTFTAWTRRLLLVSINFKFVLIQSPFPPTPTLLYVCEL